MKDKHWHPFEDTFITPCKAHLLLLCQTKTCTAAELEKHLPALGLSATGLHKTIKELHHHNWLWRYLKDGQEFLVLSARTHTALKRLAQHQPAFVAIASAHPQKAV